MFIYQVVLLIVLLIIFNIKFKKYKEIKYVSIVFAILYATGLIKFTFLPQALEVWQEISGLSSANIYFHFHLPRLVLMFPAIIISKFFYVSFDTAFTYYVIFLLHYTMILLLSLNINHRQNIRSMLILVLIIIASLYGNGRFAFPLLGMTMILKAQIHSLDKNSNNFVYYVWGLLLCAVSSGTFTIAMIHVVIGFLYLKFIKRINGCMSRKALLGTYTLILAFSTLFLAGIKKNLEYFGGSVFSMLGHGFGTFLVINGGLNILAISLLVILLGALFIIGLLFHKYNKICVFPILLSVLGVIGSLFGYFTGIMVAPAILILLVAFDCLKEG